LTIDFVEGGVVVKFESQERNDSTQLLFARNEDLQRVYNQEEEIKWTYRTFVPYTFFTVLSFSKDTVVLFTSDLTLRQIRWLIQFNILTGQIVWQQRVDTPQVWTLPPLNGRRLAVHLGDLHDKSKELIRCYDMRSGEELMCQFMQIGEMREMLYGRVKVEAASFVANTGLFIYSRFAKFETGMVGFNIPIVAMQEFQTQVPNLVEICHSSILRKLNREWRLNVTKKNNPTTQMDFVSLVMNK
ncbi:hypothetical protein PFISCL1PPCAC_17097, partial [Pristionchus fissidentatus]